MFVNLDDKAPLQRLDGEKRKVTFAPHPTIYHLPERDALFAHLTLKRQVKQLLQIAPELTPFLDALLKQQIPSEVKMAEMGMIEAYCAQNKDLLQHSFLNDFIESGGELHAVLFDARGDTSDARKAAVKAIAHRLHLKDVMRALDNRVVMRTLKDPITIHSSLEYFLDNYENVQQACIDTLFKLPPRADIHFFHLPDILNWLLEALCSGMIQLDEQMLPIAELKLASLSDLLLYFFRLHDANYGVPNKGEFISSVLEHLRTTFRKIPNSFFETLSKHLYQKLWFEERETGKVTPFVMLNGHYTALNSFASLQRAIVQLIMESKEPSQVELLCEYITSATFKHFLFSYCLSKNHEASDECFSLKHHSESSPETLCQAMHLELKMLEIHASSPLAFLHQMNNLICKEKATRLLFIQQFIFDATTDAAFFALPEDIFRNSLIRKFFAPLKKTVTSKLLLQEKELKTLFKRDSLPKSVSGTAFEIALQIALPGEDLLPLMQTIERFVQHPVTLGVGLMGDGQRLICRMNIYTEKPEFCRMTDDEIVPLNFQDFKSIKVARLL